jgi:hypothetical protein
MQTSSRMPLSRAVRTRRDAGADTRPDASVSSGRRSGLQSGSTDLVQIPLSRCPEDRPTNAGLGQSVALGRGLPPGLAIKAGMFDL